VSANVASASDLTDLASAINGVASTTGVTAELSSDRASIVLTSSEGYDIGIANNGAGSGGDAIDIDVQGPRPRRRRGWRGCHLGLGRQ
jgi:flagellin